MKNVSFDGIGEAAATFFADETVVPGQVVQMGGDRTVTACEDGAAFLGVALSNVQGCAGVQVKGFMTLPCSEPLPKAGAAVLAADGKGGVKSAGSGVACTVICADPGAEQIVVLI